MTLTILYVPANSTTWDNAVTANTTYNAHTIGTNRYHTNAVSGAPMWGSFGTNDAVCIPAGSSTNNQYTLSWEIGFYFVGASVTGQRWQKIWDKGMGGFSVYLDAMYAPNYMLTIARFCTGGSGENWYIPTTTPITPGHNWYVQISWAAGTNAGTAPHPTIYIGRDANRPVHQTSWDDTGFEGGPPTAQSGTGSWYNDSVGPANIGNYSANSMPCSASSSAHGYPFNGSIYIYRQYNSAENFSGGGSWATDVWRWTTAPSTTTISSISADADHQAVDMPVNFTARLTTGAGVAISGKSVKIYHTISGSGTQYTDTTKTTDSNGQITHSQSFSSAGMRTYYATFAGGGGYVASTSPGLNIYVVPQSYLQLSADNTNPNVDEDVHFTATLTDSSTSVPLSGKSVTIQHSLNSVIYTDKTDYTDSNGQIFHTQAFSTPGFRLYWDTFAGDDTYYASNNGLAYIEVSGDQTQQSDEPQPGTASIFTQETSVPSAVISPTETATLSAIEATQTNVVDDETPTLDEPIDTTTLNMLITRAEIATVISTEVIGQSTPVSSDEVIELIPGYIEWTDHSGVDTYVDGPREVLTLTPEEGANTTQADIEEDGTILLDEEFDTEIIEGEVI